MAFSRSAKLPAGHGFRNWPIEGGMRAEYANPSVKLANMLAGPAGGGAWTGLCNAASKPLIPETAPLAPVPPKPYYTTALKFAFQPEG